jgi:hypothetical protein
MYQFNLEVTDTFGGEANYSWRRVFVFYAKSERGAIQKLSRAYQAGWRKVWDDGEVSRYDLKGAAVCVFVQPMLEG